MRQSIAWLALLFACAAPKQEKQAWPGSPRATEPQAESAAPPKVAAAPATAPPSATRATATRPALARPATVPVVDDPPASEPTPESLELLARNPSAWAARFHGDRECQASARPVRPHGEDLAWRALKACVYRGHFRALPKLTDGFWDNDLRTRPDAARVLGRVLAARGGDLEEDLAELRRRRIPLFTLKGAIGQPDVYRGRMIVFVGRVDSLESVQGRGLAHLTEVALGSPAGARNDRWSYRGGMPVDERVFLSTELLVRAQLLRSDPFFEQGRTFLMVARFEDLPAGEEALVTLVDFSEIDSRTELVE